MRGKTYHLTAVRRMVFLCMPVYDEKNSCIYFVNIKKLRIFATQ